MITYVCIHCKTKGYPDVFRIKKSNEGLVDNYVKEGGGRGGGKMVGEWGWQVKLYP